MSTSELPPAPPPLSSHKPLRRVIKEKHDLSTLFCYDDDFPGLTRRRRGALLAFVVLLALGINLFAFGAIDGTCFKVGYCKSGCVETWDSAQCEANAEWSIEVRDLGGRVSRYDTLFEFAPAPESRAYAFCRSVGSPFFDFSPVCVELCASKADQLFGDSVVTFLFNGTRVPCELGAAAVDAVAPGAEHALLCEDPSATTTSVRVGEASTRSTFSNCGEFASRGAIPSPTIVLVKAVAIAVVLVVSEQLLMRLLLWSQPKHIDPHSAKLRAARSLSCVCAVLWIVIIFVMGVTLTVFGVYYVQVITSLWVLFFFAFSLSLFFKWAICSPSRIACFWWIKHQWPRVCNCCWGVFDDDRLVEQWERELRDEWADFRTSEIVMPPIRKERPGDGAAVAGADDDDTLKDFSIRAQVCHKCFLEPAVQKVRTRKGVEAHVCASCRDKLQRRSREATSTSPQANGGTDDGDATPADADKTQELTMHMVSTMERPSKRRSSGGAAAARRSASESFRKSVGLTPTSPTDDSERETLVGSEKDD